MSKKAKSQKMKLNKKIVIINLVLVCLFVVIYVSFSKYAIKVDDYHGIESEAFYFVSDILLVNSNGETGTYEMNDWDGTSTYTIPIVLKNYDDELKNTISDIEYTINIINDKNTTTYKTGTLKGNEKSKESINVTVTNIDIEKPEFTIEVISNRPYTKTLSATFKLHAENKYNVNYIENEQNVILNMNSYIDTKITISYDNTKYILDNGQSIFDNKTITTSGTKNSVTINIEKGEFYNITFIKVSSDINLDTSSDIVVK